MLRLQNMLPAELDCLMNFNIQLVDKQHHYATNKQMAGKVKKSWGCLTTISSPQVSLKYFFAVFFFGIEFSYQFLYGPLKNHPIFECFIQECWRETPMNFFMLPMSHILLRINVSTSKNTSVTRFGLSAFWGFQHLSWGRGLDLPATH